MEYFKKIAEKNQAEAAIRFVKWLLTVDGSIMYPYIWKPQYRKIMIDITYDMIDITVTLLNKLGII